VYMERRVFWIVGVSFLVIALLLWFDSLQGFTGYSLFEGEEGVVGSVLWLWFFVAGVGVFLLMGSLEKRLIVYDTSGGKDTNKDRSYHINPLEQGDVNDLGDGKTISLGSFRRGVLKLADDRELLDLVKQEYVAPLVRTYREGSAEEKKIAGAFLDVLGKRPNEEESSFTLKNDEKHAIKEAFRVWDGKFTAKQRSILRQYGVVSTMGGDGHYHFAYKDCPRSISVSHTPSSQRAGQYIGRDIQTLIEKGREWESTQVGKRRAA